MKESQKSKRREEAEKRKEAIKKEETLTRFSIGETDDYTQQSSHGAMRHDCTIVIEWVETDCSFTHMY